MSDCNPAKCTLCCGTGKDWEHFFSHCRRCLGSGLAKDSHCTRCGKPGANCQSVAKFVNGKRVIFYCGVD